MTFALTIGIQPQHGRYGEHEGPERRRRPGDLDAWVVREPEAMPDVLRELEVNPRVVQGKSPERPVPLDEREIPGRAEGRDGNKQDVAKADPTVNWRSGFGHGFSISAARS